MPLYLYEASDSEGAIIRGEINGDSEETVIGHLTRRNLIPITVREKGAVGATTRRGLSFSFFETIKPLDRIVLARNLGASVRAGLSIIEGLEVLIADTTKTLLRRILLEAKLNLENGQPLSMTFAAYPKYFSPVFVGLLKAGEASGQLDRTLEELTVHLSREHNLIRKIRSSLAYPLVLLVSSILVVLLLMLFILPRLVKVFEQSGAVLPPLTKVLLDVSGALSWSWPFDLAAVFSITAFLWHFRRTPAGRHFFGRFVLHIPVARDLIKKIALVRFTRTLGSLIGSGISIIEALRLAGDASGNEVYQQVITESAEQIKGGVPFSKTLEGHPELFPRFLTSLILVGERTGTLEHILKTFADFYDEEVDNSLKDLATFVEPILLLFMGLIIGAVALSVLLPIYQLVGQFG